MRPSAVAAIFLLAATAACQDYNQRARACPHDDGNLPLATAFGIDAGRER